MNPIVRSVELAGIGLVLAGELRAQTFTNLHSFTNSDGINPLSSLVISGGILYGTTTSGGSAGLGTVFKVNTDGTGFSTLHSFSGSDGADPQAGLVLSGSILYGTTAGGGSSSTGAGTVFAINANGTSFTNFYNFTGGTDGGSPYAALTLSGTTLYGTAVSGGNTGLGTVFAVNTDGTGFRNLYSFDGVDGSSPHAAMILSGSILYGTTAAGGGAGMGAVFAVNTDGTGFTNLYTFTGGNDGANPYGGLTLASNVLFGTAMNGGGLAGNGTIFAVNTDGTGFRTLWGFTRGSDGANPAAGLILTNNMLYGTAQVGGDWDVGTVFAITTDGTVFTNLHSFAGYPSEGSSPGAGLIVSGNTLYGTTEYGGASTNGTVFSLSLASVTLPELTITPSGSNVILMWPANVTGFILQSTTNLGSPSVWTTVSTAPVVVNGQNTVTNPISGTEEFFRLSQ